MQRKTKCRQTSKSFTKVVLVLSAMLAAGLSGAAQAQSQTPANQPSFIEISNDRGGLILDRMTEIQLLRQTGQAVRIIGNICYSTCTMFLGLPQTCVSPQTTFGFHGPSRYGRPLEPAVFEQASQIMASHYPEVLKDWFMKTGRYEIVRIYRFKGADMVQMGIQACSATNESS